MTQWVLEANSREKDSAGRWSLHQMTSSTLMSNNVYGEQPYTSPDGKRIAVLRSQDWTVGSGDALLVADVETLKITLVEPMGRVYGVSTSAWRQWLHYWTKERKCWKLWRVSFETMQKEQLYEGPLDDARCGGALGSVSPDFRHLVRVVRNPDGAYCVVKLEIERGEWEVLYELPDPMGHVQYAPATGDRILFQVNKGWRFDEKGNLVKMGSGSIDLTVIDARGGNPGEIPVGRPWTCDGTGHECFVGDTGRVLFSTSHDVEGVSAFSDATLFVAAAGEEKPTPVAAPGHVFNHISVSKCGRYFVADCYRDFPPRVPLIVGGIETGRTEELLETGTSCGGAQYTHPHPYFTADNRHVIYNSDATGIPQVYAAVVPEGLLESLD